MTPNNTKIIQLWPFSNIIIFFFFFGALFFPFFLFSICFRRFEVVLPCWPLQGCQAQGGGSGGSYALLPILTGCPSSLTSKRLKQGTPETSMGPKVAWGLWRRWNIIYAMARYRDIWRSQCYRLHRGQSVLGSLKNSMKLCWLLFEMLNGVGILGGS